MSDSSAAPSFPGSIRVSVEGLDPLLIATALAVASLTPGPAGEAGAVAAIAYDIKQKRWYGVALSGASMIPVFGYIPAFVKVGLLIFLVNRRLKTLEAILPEIQGSPEASLMVESVLGKYYRKLPDIWITRPLRKRLGRIMGLNKPSQDKPSQSVPCAPTDGASEDNSISAKIPE
jgi:hypothetical protein